MSAMKSPFFPRLRAGLVAVCATLSLTACWTVETGPGVTPDPDQRGTVYGVEPEHAPIPQKEVPAGESSLRKRGPDQRID